MSGRLFNLACQQAWAIQPDALQMILEIVSRENQPDFEAVAAKKAARMDGTDQARIRNGVSIIPVLGPIVRRADFFSEISGATSVESLARDFNAALNDPLVHSILFEFDSPGGEATGISEFANMISAARGKKPMVAFVDGMAASAAYWIASATDEIVTADTALLGSIGVVAKIANPDTKKASDVKFISSQSPNKQANPLTEKGAAQYQALVDHMAEVFIATVAANRGVSEETVLSDFGQGGVLVGRRAVEAGLADKLGSFESTLSDLAMGKKPKRFGVAAVAIATEESTMSEEKTLLEKIWAKVSGTPEATAIQPATTGELMQSHSSSDEAIERMKAEHLETQKALAAERQARIGVEALACYNEFFAAGKILPAEKEAFLADYKLAAADDEANPVEGAKRLDRLKQRTESRPAHGMFSERVLADGDRVLPATKDEKSVTADREKELLGMTSLGQTALKAVS